MNYDANKFATEVEVIASNLVDTLKRKNADYGNNVDKNIDEWGLASLAIRLDDKLNRFKNLIKEGQNRQVSDEAIEDTLLDLAGYAILGYRKLKEMNEGVAVFDAIGFEKPTAPTGKIPRLDVDRKPMAVPSAFTFKS